MTRFVPPGSKKTPGPVIKDNNLLAGSCWEKRFSQILPFCNDVVNNVVKKTLFTVWYCRRGKKPKFHFLSCRGQFHLAGGLVEQRI